MDALNLFAGVNVAMVAGIVAILLGLRKIVSDKLPGWVYFVGVIVLGFVAGAFVVTPFTVKAWIPAGLAHAGYASILYQSGKLVVTATQGKPSA